MRVRSTNASESHTARGILLTSYETPVAAAEVKDGKVVRIFKTRKKWSMTTTKHINEFLRRHGGPDVEVKEVDQEFFD